MLLPDAITPDALAALRDANNATLADLLVAANLASPSEAVNGTALLMSAH